MMQKLGREGKIVWFLFIVIMHCVDTLWRYFFSTAWGCFEYFPLKWILWILFLPTCQCGQIHTFAGKDTEIIIFRDVPAWIWVASSENVENLILQTHFEAHKPCNYLILAETNSFRILLPALLAEFGNYATYLDFGINGFAVSSRQGLQLAFSLLRRRIGHYQTTISLQHSP